jgi:hypothetical protein
MSWIAANRDKIQAWQSLVTAIVTPLALIATVISLIVTSMSSHEQLRLAATSAQGAMIYQALKDTREVGSQYHSGKASEQSVFATMQAIYLQYTKKTIPVDEWAVFDQDFCNMLVDEHLRNAWAQENRTLYWSTFVTYLDEVSKRAAAHCK